MTYILVALAAVTGLSVAIAVVMLFVSFSSLVVRLFQWSWRDLRGDPCDLRDIDDRGWTRQTFLAGLGALAWPLAMVFFIARKLGMKPVTRNTSRKA